MNRALFLAAALAASSLMVPAGDAMADGAHHMPMGPPLSVVCAAKPVAQQFDCLRPGFVSSRASLATLVSWSTGSGGGCGVGYHMVFSINAPFKCVINPPAP